MVNDTIHEIYLIEEIRRVIDMVYDDLTGKKKKKDLLVDFESLLIIDGSNV